jgi:hypothetical protein
MQARPHRMPPDIPVCQRHDNSYTGQLSGLASSRVDFHQWSTIKHQSMKLNRTFNNLGGTEIQSFF